MAFLLIVGDAISDDGNGDVVEVLGVVAGVRADVVFLGFLIGFGLVGVSDESSVFTGYFGGLPSFRFKGGGGGGSVGCWKGKFVLSIRW